MGVYKNDPSILDHSPKIDQISDMSNNVAGYFQNDLCL